MALTNTKLAVDEIESKTLYVGNLPQEVTELLLIDLFKNLGHVLNCKIIKDGVNDPYCFIEYEDYNSALSARSAMDGRNLLGKNLKVSWANSATNAPKVDTSKHYHIFVGDLNPDITTYKLKEAFIQFGEISDCRVVKDLQTSKSKGYGFVSFVYKEDAQNAINAMNGQWLGSRVIRTNWATRKPYTTSNHPSYTLSAGGGMYPTHKDDNPDNNNNNNEAPASYTSSTNGASHATSLNHYPYQQAPSNSYYNHKGQGYSTNYDNTPRHRSMSRKPLNYNDVFNQASHLNTTVYCGGVRSGLSEQLIRETFYKFGDIVDLRVFAEKGFAFIKFLTKEAACRAIVDVNHTEIGGYVVRCSWGKENSEALTTLQALPSTYLTAGATGGGGGLQQFVNNGTSGALGLLHGAHQQQYYALAAQPGAAYLYAQPSALQGVPYYAAAAAAATHTNLNGPNGNTPNQQLGLSSLGAGGQHQMLAGNVFTNLNQHQFQQQLALQQHQLQCLTLGSNGPSPSQSTNFGAGPAYIYGSLTPQYESSSCSFNNDMATGQNGNGGAVTNRLPNHNNNHHLHPSYASNGGGGGGGGPNPNANNTNGLIPPSMAAIQGGGGVGNIMTPTAGGYVRGTAILNPAAGAAALVPSYMAGSLPLSLLSNHPAAGTSGPGLLGPSSLTAMPNYAYGYGYSPYWYAAASPTSPYATGPGMTQYVQPQAASLALPTPVNPQGLGILPTGWSPLQHQAHHVANTNQLQQASPLAPSSHNASAININNSNLTPNNGLNNQSMPPPQFATIQPYSAQ